MATPVLLAERDRILVALMRLCDVIAHSRAELDQHVRKVPHSLPPRHTLAPL